MEGVTTAIVAFLFVCVVFPSLVKHKPQYYAAFAAIVIIILLHGLISVVGTAAFLDFAAFMIALLQVIAMILLFLSVGGLTWKQFAGEVTSAIEVMRRGETSKEIVIPLPPDAPMTIKSDPPAKPSAPAGRPIISDSDSTVPME